MAVGHQKRSDKFEILTNLSIALNSRFGKVLSGILIESSQADQNFHISSK